VLRAAGTNGPWVPVTRNDILCLGSCFADDREALPGVAYWYRFDLLLPDGARVSYGPYAATFPPALMRRNAVRVLPNPARGPVVVEVFLPADSPGRGPGTITVHDAQGRVVKRIFRGPLASGRTSFHWDGLDASGESLPAGVYFVRLETSSERAGATFTHVR